MSAPEKSVSYHCDAGLGIIHMADGRGNKLNGSGLNGLSSALQQGLTDDDVKLLLLRSGEESFCLGMDLEHLQDSLEGGGRQEAQVRGSGVEAYARLLYDIARCKKPVIALVEGAVKAGGVGLASACDVVLASTNVSYELSEVLFGLVPYNVLPYVFGLRMSPQRFRYLVLSAARIDGETARLYGLVDELYEVDVLEKKVKAFLKTMMRAQPQALASSKAFFTDMIDTSFAGRRFAAQNALLEKMRDSEVLEGLRAFGDGELPLWFTGFKPREKISGKACGQ